MHSPFHHLLFLPLFLPHLPFTLAAVSTGDISISTDSSCLPDASHSFSPRADSCYTLPDTAQSYIVNSRPTCSDGSTAEFAYYNDQNCPDAGFGSAWNSHSDDGDTSNDGICLGPVEFNSLAFLCNGLDTIGDGEPTATFSVPGSEDTGVASVIMSDIGGSVPTSALPDSAPTVVSVVISSSSSSSPKTRTTVVSATTPLPVKGSGSSTGTVRTTSSGLPAPSPSPSPSSGGSVEAPGKISLFGSMGVAVVVSSVLLFL
ncbi:MAG: hypothetical protein Q9202_000339 [Teloschistes flavicans]